jgi:predicted secreted protein
MKKVFLFIFAFLCSATLNAQAPDTLCTRTYGGSDSDWGYSVQQTSDGGFMVAGNTESFGTGAEDVWLIRTDATGDAPWTRTYGGGDYDFGKSGQQTSDGGFIVTGYNRSFSGGECDLWLIRTDATVDTLWTRTYGGSGGEAGWSVQETSDGGFIMAGYTSSFGAGGDDVWLIRSDSLGRTLWARNYGGSLFDVGNSVQQTSDGGFIVVGETQSFGAGGGDVWLIRTDASGDTLWTRTYGGSDYDGGYSVQQTSDGGFIVAGVTDSFGAGSADVWLIRLASEVVSVEEEAIRVPAKYALLQNYPNPFNPSTTVTFAVPEAAEVTLAIYNLRGQLIHTLYSGPIAAGRHSVVWEGTDFRGAKVASGVYVYGLKAKGFVTTRKLVFAK